MVKAIKNQKAIFIFLKMMALLALGIFFYFRLEKISWSSFTIESHNSIWLLCSLLLVPLNWFFEWRKWKLTLEIAEINEEKSIERISFYAGIVTGMLTPNMLGNFIGRIYYFQRSIRPTLIILTLMSNFAQFIVSMLLGIVSILLLQRLPVEIEMSIVLPLIGGIGIFLILFYFNFERLLIKFNKKIKVAELIRNLKDRRGFRWKLLSLSFLRHLVFTFQFVFVLAAFGENMSFENMLWIWQVYLWVTLAPSLFLGKLAIRESIAIWVLTLIGMNDVVVLLSSLIIWTINLLIPTLFSLVFVKSKSA